MWRDVDADPRVGRFGLRTECRRCGTHLPVNGPAPAVDCADCGEHHDVPEALLRQLLDGFEASWPGGAERGSETVGDLTWRWSTEPVEGVACGACEAVVAPTRGDDGALRWSCSCGAEVAPTELPAHIRKMSGGSARWLVGGRLDVLRGAASAAAPVALACPSCGGSLTITTSDQRVTSCKFCASQVHLPDAVWRQLHPPRKVREWFVVFEGDSRHAVALRQRAAELVRESATRKEKQAAKEAKQQRDRERAAREAEDAERKRVEAEAARAEADKWWQITTLPLMLLSALSVAGALAAMSGSALWMALGHTRLVRMLGVGPTLSRFIADGGVIVAVAVVMLAWVFSVFAAARRTRKPFSGLLFWCAFLFGLCVIPAIGPLIGLIAAVAHFRGSEPTTGANEVVPLGTGWPLGVLLLASSVFAQVVYAALGDMTAGAVVVF